MVLPKIIKSLSATCSDQLLQESCTGKTLAQLEPVLQRGGKVLIAVPAQLLNELNESQQQGGLFNRSPKCN